MTSLFVRFHTWMVASPLFISDTRLKVTIWTTGTPSSVWGEANKDCGNPNKSLKNNYMEKFSIEKPNLIAIVGQFLAVWLFSRPDAIWAIFQFLGCQQVNFYNTIDTEKLKNGSNLVRSGNQPHRKEATHNGNKVYRLFNWEFFHTIIFLSLLLGFPYKSLNFCWLSLTLSLGHLCTNRKRYYFNLVTKPAWSTRIISLSLPTNIETAPALGDPTISVTWSIWRWSGVITMVSSAICNPGLFSLLRK